MTSDPVIETSGLTKAYRDVPAVQELNLAVKRGCITAFLGRNGAGKSTTIKMLLGMIAPSAGDGTVLGKRIRDAEANRAMRQRVAYVAENKPLYGYMTVEQTIRFASSFYPDWQADRAKILLQRYDLPPNRKVRRLSKGMRTKLALLLAFARRAELVILDEPSEGLDPVGIEDLLENMVGLAADGATIFFSSHQIAEVERVADSVCVLEKGRLLVDASMDHLRESYRRIELVFDAPPPVDNFQMNGVRSVRGSGCHVSVFVSQHTHEVVERAHDLRATSIEVAPVGLREIFLETVKES